MNTYKSRSETGFALPTVIIASVVLMMLLLVAASATTSIREALYAQYYRRLAREAAESGVVYANKCLEQSNNLAEWSNSAKLKPGTDCKGVTVAGRSAYVQQYGTIRTTFEVSEPDRREASVQRVTVVGRTELFRTTNNSVWKSYEYRLAGQLGLSTLLDSVTFGYATGNPAGAFFTTIDEFGRPKSAGFNGFGQLGLGNTNNTLTPKQFNIMASKRAVRAYTNFLSHGRNLFVLTDTGEVWGSGLNNKGQLGDPTKTAQNITTPTQFRLPSSDNVATFVAPLGAATFVVTSQGNVYVAGDNSSGMAGVNSAAASITTPTKIPLPEKVLGNAQSWALDSKTAYVIGESGAVYAWGSNEFGQLAQNDRNNRLAPVKVGNYGTSGQPKAVQLAFDGDTVYIRNSNGGVQSAGKTNFGQTGTPYFRLQSQVSRKCLTAVGSSVRTEDCNNSSSQLWRFNRGTNTMRVSGNPSMPSAVCLESKGSGYTELGMAACSSVSVSQKFDFRYRQGEPNLVYVSNSTNIGGRGTCMEQSNSTTGEVKLGTCEFYSHKLFVSYAPTLQTIFPSGIIDISTDQYFATAVSSTGAVYTWGLNVGALGNGVYVDANNPDAYKRQIYNPTPVRYILPSGTRAVSSWTTSNGWNPRYANVFVTTTDGRVFGAGSNVDGQLGLGYFGGGTSGIHPTPQAMTILGTDGNLASYVRSGFGTTVVYTSNRKVFTVGNNTNGQLGDDTTTNSFTPKANKNTNTQQRAVFY